ncbi:MAG: molybdopterin synthase sulfur carrier subunit [Phototrophicales bacterium]|nr:MAG: molybdopterin synthase sulfur carrier subunit [Phototrophicales bacterium]
MATITIPTPLRTFTEQNKAVEVTGSTVRQALDDLTRQYPALRDHLFNGAELRRFVNIYIGEEDIRFLSGLDTEISADESLRIIPTVAGGKGA